MALSPYAATALMKRPRRARYRPEARLSICTDDEELHARLSEMEVAMLRAEVAPPPNTLHLAVRTDKRYGKTSLTARHGRDLARAAACVPVAARANWIRTVP